MSTELLLNQLMNINGIELIAMNFKVVDKKNTITCNIIYDSPYISTDIEEYMNILTILEELHDTLSSKKILFHYSIKLLTNFIDDLQFNVDENYDIFNANLLYIKSDFVKEQVNNCKNRKRAL